MSATTVPTPEQQQRAQWDLLLLDLETRSEQLRQLKTFEPRKLLLSGITTGAAVFGSGVRVPRIAAPLDGQALTDLDLTLVRIERELRVMKWQLRRLDGRRRRKSRD